MCIRDRIKGEHQAVFLAAGETWRASVVTADLDLARAKPDVASDDPTAPPIADTMPTVDTTPTPTAATPTAATPTPTPTAATPTPTAAAPTAATPTAATRA